MRLPEVAAGDDVYNKYINHFDGAAEAWHDAEILNDDQQKAILAAQALVAKAGAALRTNIVALDQASYSATKLRARFSVRDILLDMRIMAVSDALLNGPAHRDRKSPVYKSVFQEGNAGEITDSKIRDEPEIAQRVSERLGKVAEFDAKSRVKADLDTALQKSFDARDALDDAEMAENQAGDAQIQARLDVRKALEQAYGILRTAFAGQRKLVESFFPRRERASKSDTPEDGDERPDEG